MVCYSDATMVVWLSDHHLVKGSVFKPPFEYKSAIQMSCTMVPGIRISNHLNTDQVKVHFSDVCCSYLHCILFFVNSYWSRMYSWYDLSCCNWAARSWQQTWASWRRDSTRRSSKLAPRSMFDVWNKKVQSSKHEIILVFKWKYERISA